MANKLMLHYEDSDLPKLKEFMNGQVSSILQDSFKAAIGAAATEDVVRYKVFTVLANISGYDISTINDQQDLSLNLGLSLYHKKALKIPFNEILAELSSPNTITIGECQVLKKVKDCLKLVNSKL